MERREFAQKLMALGVCPFVLSGITIPEAASAIPEDDKYNMLKGEKDFICNWLTDLLDSMEQVVDRETQVKIIEGCGRGCFNRHQFKKDIAAKGSGDLDKLIEAYSQNFEIWKEENSVHIRYGETSSRCYCPAANYRDSKPDDIHCECTRTTHQTIFETALGKPFRVDIVESLRRGGKTCHFLVHLS